MPAIPDEFDHIDLGLFGTWGDGRHYGPDVAMDDGDLADAASAALEVKSADGLASPGDELRHLLNEMTLEMRAQFATFRKMRESAAEALHSGDEAAQKLARADVKAATDSMNLIVRTLEKVDALQRQLSRDREIEAERVADEGGYAEAKARFVKMIEDRANENAYRLYQAWQRDGPPAWVVDRLGDEVAQPANIASGGGGDSREGSEGFDAEKPDNGDDRHDPRSGG